MSHLENNSIRKQMPFLRGKKNKERKDKVVIQKISKLLPFMKNQHSGLQKQTDNQLKLF